MLVLDSQTRIAELAASGPAMMQALQRCGIFKPGDDASLTIGELCFSFGLNPAFLLQTLESAREKEQSVLPEVQALADLTLTHVVEHIERQHHDFLRDLLPGLAARLGEVHRLHGKSDARLEKVEFIFRQLADDLDKHLRHEEESLFRMIREMDAVGGISPTRCGSAVGGPIACMENEHDMTRDALVQLRELTDGYTAPGGSCGLYRDVIADLKRLDADMAVHMAKEDQVLFPRAIQAQRALRA